MSRSKIILRTITTLLVVVVVLLAFSVSLIRIFGFEVYGVLTGSMEPKYPVGSLIYVKEINTEKLEVGDAISFKLTENVIATHRIVEIVPSETAPGAMSYRTKGDANDVVDSSLVEEADIIGKVVFCVPKMGYVLEYIQSPSGIVTTIIVSLVLIALVFVSEMITSDSEMLWRIRCAITGESGRSPNRRGGDSRQRRMPYPEEEPRRRSRYEDDYHPQQRARAPRYEDDYRDSRRSSGSRSSSRGYDDYGSSRSSSTRSSRSYDDYGESRRASSSRSSSRGYDDYGSSRSSSTRSSRSYDDYGESRRASSSRSSSRGYDDYGSSRSSSTRSSRSYDDYGASRRASSSRSSSRGYDDYGSSRSSARSSQDGYSSRRSRSTDSDYR